MATKNATIDISDLPKVRRVAEAARDRRTPIVLQAHGKDIAIVTPIAPVRGDPDWKPTPEEVEIAMTAFGSWQGLIDPDELKAQIKAARGSRRPPVEL